MDFKQADEKFRQLKARFEAGNLTEAEFKAQLKDLMVQDEQGSWWMIGYETERWYRHDGTSWVQADPPASLPRKARPVIPPQPETTKSKDIENDVGMRGMRQADGKPAISAPTVPRQRYIPIVIAGLVILFIGGYLVLRTFGLVGSPAAPEVPTEAPAQAPAATAAPAAGAIDCAGAKSGDEISLIYQWSGQEEERFNQIVKPLVDACGIVFKPESTRDYAVLDTRVQAGTPPDIAFWNVTQLQQYKDKLFPMDQLGASQDSYIPGAVTPGIIDGRWLGLPVKSDLKTIIWYSPANFTALGYTVPTTWDELNTLVEKMVTDGHVPWSMGLESGGATGWTGSDFIQDILLVQQGPEYVMSIINGTTPYNDAGVKQAYETYGKWAKDPKYTVGGAQGTLSTSFLQAIYKPFADPPEAMMVKQSGFAGGTIAKQFPALKYGTDYDFFVVPGAKGLQGGSDWMMAFSDKPAVKALVTYLASPEGGANWAKAGFDLSPNKGAEGQYSDPALVKKAEAFYSTQGLTPDIGDTIPGGFGSAEWKAIMDYLNGTDLDTALAGAAAAQKEALRK